MSKIVIIGGGFAGLSSAVFLSNKNHTVHLLEASPKLGGRAYSFYNEKYDDVIDNGQHLMMGCYKNSLGFFELIGASKKVIVQKKMKVIFRDRNRKTFSLKSSNNFYPFNLIFALLNYEAVSLKERIEILKLFVKLPFVSYAKLSQMNLADWLDQNGQSKESRKALWDILCVGTLNTKSQNAAANIFALVLKKVFLNGNKSSLFIIPSVGLSSLYCEPAVEFILQRGGTVTLSEKVIGVVEHDNKLIKIITDKREITGFDFVISAVPHFQYKKIFNLAHNEDADNLEYSPIITMHLWLKENPFHEKFFGMIDSKIHWLFNHEKHISLITSDAAELVKLKAEEIFEIYMNELSEYFPEFNRDFVKDYIVLKEKRATFVPSISSKFIREKVISQYKNLILAGDWTNTGLPSTIESAVQSGKLVADKIIRE
ncbi:MAG: hydroxysqualene dehydroxylase HpnE [bacterium]